MDEQNEVDADCDALNPCCLIPTSTRDWIVYITMSLLTYSIHQTFNLPGPRCYIQQFYVPALDLSVPPPENASNSTNPFLFFDLSLKNILADRSISYGDVNLTFSYGRSAVANYTVPSFYQGRWKTAQRRDLVETSGVPWADAVKAVSSGSKAVFRVELAARPRFKFLLWYSKEKAVRIAADVAVDGTGMKVGNDDIRLDSAAAKRGIGVFVLFLSIFVATYLLH